MHEYTITAENNFVCTYCRKTTLFVVHYAKFRATFTEYYPKITSLICFLYRCFVFASSSSDSNFGTTATDSNTSPDSTSDPTNTSTNDPTTTTQEGSNVATTNSQLISTASVDSNSGSGVATTDSHLISTASVDSNSSSTVTTTDSQLTSTEHAVYTILC